MKLGIRDRILEGTLLGYTKIGSRLRDLPPVTEDMSGKRVVVTGASSGLGKYAVGALAKLGADVTLVGRNRDKTQAVADELVAAGAGGSIDVELADLSLMVHTRALGERLLNDARPIHVLINNAGVMINERRITREGIEATLATNLLSHFVLTNALIPKLKSTASAAGAQDARIINVSSGGMYTQRIRVDDLQFEEGYDGTIAYARTKRGQVILTEMWAEQLAGSGVLVHSMHPGWADTPGVQDAMPIFRAVTKAVLRDSADGADTVVWLAATRDEAVQKSGQFWHDRRAWPTHRMKRTRETPEERMRLWQQLEALGTKA